MRKKNNDEKQFKEEGPFSFSFSFWGVIAEKRQGNEEEEGEEERGGEEEEEREKNDE